MKKCEKFELKLKSRNLWAQFKINCDKDYNCQIERKTSLKRHFSTKWRTVLKMQMIRIFSTLFFYINNLVYDPLIYDYHYCCAWSVDRAVKLGPYPLVFLWSSQSDLLNIYRIKNWKLMHINRYKIWFYVTNRKFSPLFSIKVKL